MGIRIFDGTNKGKTSDSVVSAAKEMKISVKELSRLAQPDIPTEYLDLVGSRFPESSSEETSKSSNKDVKIKVTGGDRSQTETITSSESPEILNEIKIKIS